MQAVMTAPMMEGSTDVETSSASRADDAMDRYAGGEEAAFAELYDALAPRLHRFALRWTRSRAASVPRSQWAKPSATQDEPLSQACWRA